METNKQIPIKYSQNFLKSGPWLDAIIDSKTDINHEDLVLDIGVGSGVLSKILASHAKEVIGFELDPEYFKKLPQNSNASFKNLDFLNFDTSTLNAYKVFSNIPFFLTNAIVRKLFLESSNKPQEAHLFMQYEAATRIIGTPYERDSLLALLLKPFWKIEISHTFKASDFQPAPSVKVVLVSFRPVNNNVSDISLYQDFVSYVLNTRKATIKLSFLDLFTFNQLQFISRELKLNLALAPSTLTFDNWLAMWQRFQRLVSPDKQALVRGSYTKLSRHQSKLNKDKQIIF